MCCIIGSYQPFALSLPEIYPVALHTLLGLSPNTEYPKAAHFGFIVGIRLVESSFNHLQVNGIFDYVQIICNLGTQNNVKSSLNCVERNWILPRQCLQGQRKAKNVSGF